MKQDDPLLSYLRDQAPASLLCLSFNKPEPVEQYLMAHRHASARYLNEAKSWRALDGLGRFDVVVLIDQLEHTSRREGLMLIGRLRNQHSNSLCVEIARHADWNQSDFMAAGLVPSATYERAGKEVMLLTYDIATYNPEREWNNPEQWAHPDRFHKFRW